MSRVLSQTDLDTSRLSVLPNGTRDEIALRFFEAAINAREDSLLLFYYAGHGSVDLTGYDVVRGSLGGYMLFAHDSGPENVLNLDMIKAAFRATPAKLGVLLLDV